MESPSPTPKTKTHECETCGYSTRKRCDYDKHLLTIKHKIAIGEEVDTKASVPRTHKCFCGNEYKHRQSLYNHRMKCDIHANRKLSAKEEPIETCETLAKEESLIMQESLITQEPLIMQESLITQESLTRQEPLITIENSVNQMTVESTLTELIKQNKELKSAIMEQNAMFLEYVKTNPGITNNTTNHNQQFNLNFYLNEICKDAINITDFLDTIKLQIDDLNATGKLGYAEGISRIFIRALKSIDVEKRPIHCTDMKRETVYVKDQNAWEKEDDDKNKMRRAVNQIARMNFGQIPAWKESNPGYDVMDTPKNNEYLNITMSAMGGRTDDEEDKYMNKIIKNVLKEVTVDKDMITTTANVASK